MLKEGRRGCECGGDGFDSRDGGLACLMFEGEQGAKSASEGFRFGGKCLAECEDGGVGRGRRRCR